MDEAAVELPYTEFNVDEDLVVVGTVSFDPSEPFEDFSVLKLAFDLRLRSAKKGIVQPVAFH